MTRGADFDGLADELHRLADNAETLVADIEAASLNWPKAPGQVANAAGMARHAATGLRRGIARLAELEDLARQRDERTAVVREQRKYDQHTKDMAERMGITPEAFLELQEERRRSMRGAPGTVTLAPDHKVIR